MIEVILLIAVLWLYFVAWFFAVGSYLRLKREKMFKYLPSFIQGSLIIALLPGLVVDFLFNITYGTIHYRRLPTDLLFSGTTATVLEEGEQQARWGNPSTRYKRAERWSTILNTIDPGHI